MTTIKRALLTGGNRGIGLAIAQGLLAQDYEAIVTARSIAAAKQTAEQLGEKAIPLELDVSEDRSITYGMLRQRTGDRYFVRTDRSVRCVN